MHTREFPVLSRDDREFVDRLAIGLGKDAARVFAYLLLREERDEFAADPASRLGIRIGTGLGQRATTAALDDLEDRGLVAASTLESGTRGRPPKAWRATRRDAISRSHRAHARALLRQAREVAAALGADEDLGADDGLETDGEPTAADAAATGEAIRIRLGLNWRPNGLHAPFFAGVAEGAYADRGVDVSFEQHRGSRGALESVASGETDVGIAGAATLLRAGESDGRASGETVVPIALLFQRATTTLYTIRDTFGEEFRSVEQLRGRRVGMPRGSETGVLGRLFLSQANVLDDVRVVDTGGEEREALLSGRVDVVTGSFADPQRLAAEGVAVDSMLVAEQFPMCGSALVVRMETLGERGDLLARFLAGTMDGLAFAVRRPAAAAEAIYPRDGSGNDDGGDEAWVERERRTFERAADEFGTGEAVQRHGWGWQRVEAWRRLETVLRQGRLLEGAP